MAREPTREGQKVSENANGTIIARVTVVQRIMPTAKANPVSRLRGTSPTTPPPASALFNSRIPEHAVEVVPGCVYLIRNWMPKKLADQIGVRVVEETYEASLPQYRIGKKGVPLKDEDNRLVRLGDPDLNTIVYKGKEQPVGQWTDALLELKTVLQEELGVPFNSASVRYLVNGKVATDPHSDIKHMPALGDQPVIAHLGFGVSRRYEFRAMNNRDKVAFSCEVNHGDLLLFVGRSQLDWIWAQPALPSIKNSRVQITYRFVLPGFQASKSSHAQLRRISTTRMAAVKP